MAAEKRLANHVQETSSQAATDTYSDTADQYVSHVLVQMMSNEIHLVTAW
jgi:hypothetical protein